jgi:hypothetical protein
LGGLLVPIVAIIVGGAVAIATMILRHQERIAKIERGIDPDAPPRVWRDQPDVGRQWELTPNIGLEAFWGLHDSGTSKTHTRRSGVSEAAVGRRVLADCRKPTAERWFHEDDIWQLNRLGNYKAL